MHIAAAALISFAALAAARSSPHGGLPQSWQWGPSKTISACSVVPTGSPSSSTSPSSAPRPSCVVNGLGAGQDDGPNILAAFEQCKKGGSVILADYYSVDTLLLVTGLDDVEIELSGTRKDIAESVPVLFRD